MLEPPYPNELMEALLSPPVGHEKASWGNWNDQIHKLRQHTALLTFRFQNSSSILGLRFWRFSLFGGMTPFSKASMTFIIPAMPLPPSRCPTFDFMDPLWDMSVSFNQRDQGTHIYKGSAGERCDRKTEPMALVSIGSPMAVPFSCESIFSSW